jgi:nicotinamidase/pyrazinamidase
MNNALILVDVQNDFMPGGALAVPYSDEIISLINQLIQVPFDYIVATKDWHPTHHKSFAINHAKQPGEHVQLIGIDQILWPSHCIQYTTGAEFAPGWDTTLVDKIVYKVIDPDIDSYSTFFDNGHLRSTGLENELRAKNIQTIYIAGLATDYCVKFSVMDALHLGFKVYVITDACRGVNLKPQDSTEAFDFMRQAGAHLISTQTLLQTFK